MDSNGYTSHSIPAGTITSPINKAGYIYDYSETKDSATAEYTVRSVWRGGANGSTDTNGAIPTRSNDTQDARMKQICLTDKAKNAEDTFHSMAEEDEALITKDFSAEEILILTSLLEKIRHNIEQEEAL